MKLRLSTFAAPTVAVLSLLAGCSSQDDPIASTSGSPAGGIGPVSRGSGGLGSGGLNASGVSGGGAGRLNTAAVSGGGSGGSSPAGSAAAGSTAGAPSDAGAIPTTFATVKLVLGGGGGIMPCNAAPCHGVNGMAPPGRPLELPQNNNQQLYTNLTSYVSTACNNKLVTPGNPAQSALVTILSGPCGSTPRMPYGCSAEAGDCIPDEYIAAVAQWIAQGAAQ